MRDEIQKRFERMDEAVGGSALPHGTGAFYDGDRVRVSQSADKVKRELRGKTGTVVKWHHDDVYTVDIGGREYVLTAKEMELSEKRLREANMMGGDKEDLDKILKQLEDRSERLDTLAGELEDDGIDLDNVRQEYDAIIELRNGATAVKNAWQSLSTAKDRLAAAIALLKRVK
jgi:hypothetical protein